MKSKNHIDSLVVLLEDSDLPNIKKLAYNDSLYDAVKDMQNDTLTRYYYKKAAVNYYNLDAFDKSIKVSRKVYKMSSDVKDTIGMAKGLYFLGVSYYGKSDLDSAYYFYAGAEKLYSQLKNTDTRTLGEIVLYKAYIYYRVGEFVLCEEEAYRAMKLLKVQNKSSDLYNCYNLIANSVEGLGKYKEAIEYFKTSLSYADGYKDEGYTQSDVDYIKATCYNNMGTAYVKMGQLEKAIDIYNQALAIPEARNSPALYAKLINNLASVKYKSGNDAGVPALLYKSLKIRDSINDEAGIIASDITLGEYSLYKEDTLRAVRYLKSAYTKAKVKNSNEDILSSLRTLSAIDKNNKDFYFKRYVSVSDSLQRLAENTRNKFAKIEYDTDRIITEKEALAKKNSFIIGVSVIVLFFVAAIFIIYYLNSRNKELLLIQEQQRANEEIYELMFEQQGKIETARTEEKSRIAMELHDGILNNIYAVRLNLEFINKKADDESIAKRKEYIKELQNVESEIRGVSHDLSRNAIFNQEQSFENLLEFMIVSQKNEFETEFEADIDSTIDWQEMSNVVKVNVYRIIQEALQNVNKYSEAGYVKVTAGKQEDKIVITVVDNGKGFDPEKAKGGIGLKNLKKRTEALNGILQITSKPGEGTTIAVQFSV
ncbi:sensor histidine kinase [Flavobacterium sp. DG1-102-2]|uniref:tetratricopeptide repeat-containing sensor histidine kinase n=1 Tax=Flavobacterium sp. DG1-102-2 TaxID=3081663 RepID=UPI0029495501|nr:sensor histidine kinase [Flavobacterium sp. DG1-102-2]MDV6168218.1 sensor histidine kinase [Flavobacterium sp. DG1-102-2]